MNVIAKAAKKLVQLPKAESPLARTGVCTVAIALISVGSVNIINAMNGGNLNAIQAAWSVGGFGTGALLIYVFHCDQTMRGA